MLILLHNPRCSKSRQALALLEERGADVQPRRYLDDPLSEQELRQLVGRLEGDLRDLVRTGEAEWKDADVDIEDSEAVIATLVARPKVLQRPIADDGRRAVIGRPPENVLALLD